MGLDVYLSVFLSKSKRKLIIIVRQNRENIVIKYETVEVVIAISKSFLPDFGKSKNCTNEYIKNPVAAIISKKASA